MGLGRSLALPGYKSPQGGAGSETSYLKKNLLTETYAEPDKSVLPVTVFFCAKDGFTKTSGYSLGALYKSQSCYRNPTKHSKPTKKNLKK